MEWQFDNERPIYAQLVEQIEQAVIKGLYPPGARLPGVRELAGDAGVNPNTMQRALAELEARGLLYSQRTSGRFVTSDEQLLHSARGQLAGGITQDYVGRMQGLGCTQDEIVLYVRRELDKDAKEES